MRTWLAVTYRVPAEPSRTRVYLWRKLKELGAVYLQQGAAVLPMQENLLAQVQVLKTDVAADGGEVMISNMVFVDAADDDRVVNTFQTQRDADYREIIEQCDRLVNELEQETSQEKFTYAEIEENETELTRIHKWMERIIARDWFSAPGRAGAEQALTAAEERSHVYTEEVERREGHESDIHMEKPRS